MLRVLLITAVVLGVLFGAGKYYFHHRVAKAVDSAIVPLQAVADVSYGSITSSLTGAVGIANLNIKPHGFADAIQIDNITAQFPDLGYVLQLEDNINDQNYPDSLFLTVNRMSLSTRGSLVRSLDAAALAQIAASDLPGSCVSRAANMASELAELGYDRLALDYSTGYQHNPDTGELSLSGYLRQASAFSMDYELVIPFTALSAAGAGLFMTEPEITSGSLKLEDEGYYDRLLAHCSKIENRERAAVTDDMVAVWAEQMSGMGLPPDLEMLADYHQFLTSGKTFSLNAVPHEPVKLQYLSLYEAKDIPNALNIATAAH